MEKPRYYLPQAAPWDHHQAYRSLYNLAWIQLTNGLPHASERESGEGSGSSEDEKLAWVL